MDQTLLIIAVMGLLLALGVLAGRIVWRRATAKLVAQYDQKVIALERIGADLQCERAARQTSEVALRDVERAFCEIEHQYRILSAQTPDITQYKETEEALRDSVRRIQLIADNLPALIAYVDAQQVYRFANRQFEEWYTTPDIIGRHLREIAGEQQYQAIRDYVDTALAGTPITFDYSRTYPDGRRRFVEIAYIPHLGPDGQVLGFFTLVQDVTERKVAEEQIKASLDEKVVLLKEIHHRVKNNLQVISSLLSLQSEQIDDPQVRALLYDSQNRVRSMALIHEKLYQAKDQMRVDVAEYIQNLTGYLFRSYAAHVDGIHLKVKVDNVHLAIDTAMPCGLIINELLSNALKHAFPNQKRGEIYIELRYAPDGLCTLLVGDTGVGMPDQFDLDKSPSLGLQLVHTLVRQLDGSIEVRRNGGVEFFINFSDIR